MRWVAVDQVFIDHAPEIIKVLEEAGLHPRFDDLPRHALKGQWNDKTDIFVPESEANHARAQLKAYYDKAEYDINARMRSLPPWWSGLIQPFLFSLALGIAVALISKQFALGVAVCLAGCIFALLAKSRRIAKKNNPESL